MEELPLQAEAQGWKRRRRSRRRPAGRPRGYAAPGRDPVHRVAGDRKADRGEVNADLMGPARLEPDAQERVPLEQLLELEVRHGGARRIRLERVAEPVVAVAADRRVDRPAPPAGGPHAA